MLGPQGTQTILSGYPAGRVCDQGDRQNVHVPNSHVPFCSLEKTPCAMTLFAVPDFFFGLNNLEDPKLQIMESRLLLSSKRYKYLGMMNSIAPSAMITGLKSPSGPPNAVIAKRRSRGKTPNVIIA